MKHYKEFDKVYLGTSDIATLICVGFVKELADIALGKLNFGGDGAYYAYLVEGDAIIGEHYKKEFEFNSWFKIYDDKEMTFKLYAEKIIIYTAGNYGCIIQYYN